MMAIGRERELKILSRCVAEIGSLDRATMEDDLIRLRFSRPPFGIWLEVTTPISRLSALPGSSQYHAIATVNVWVQEHWGNWWCAPPKCASIQAQGVTFTLGTNGGRQVFFARDEVKASDYAPKPIDTPNYGGWSDGDVMMYLTSAHMRPRREVRGTPPHDGWVIHNNPFTGYVWYRAEATALAKKGWVVNIGAFERQGFETLPEGMEWAFERWSRWVVEKPFFVMPERLEKAPPVSASVRHVMTGDLGQRTTFGGDYLDPAHEGWDPDAT